MNLSNICWISTVLALHLCLHRIAVILRSCICRTNIGDLFANILTHVFRIHTCVKTTGYRDSKHPGTPFLSDLGICGMRDDLGNLSFCSYIHNR